MFRPSETANPPRAALELVVRNASGHSRRYEVANGLTLGRSRACTVIVEDDGSVDPTHARVEIAADGTAWVRCLEPDRTLVVGGEATWELLLGPGVRFQIGPADFACVPGPPPSPAGDRPARESIARSADRRHDEDLGEMIESPRTHTPDSAHGVRAGCPQENPQPLSPSDPVATPDGIGDPAYLVLWKALRIARWGVLIAPLPGLGLALPEGQSQVGPVQTMFTIAVLGVLGGFAWIGYYMALHEGGMAPSIGKRFYLGASLGVLIGLLLSREWRLAISLGILVGDVVAIAWLILWLRGETADTCLKRGREMVRWADVLKRDKDRWDLAIALFTRAVRLHPFYAPAYFERALAYGKREGWTGGDSARARAWILAELERAVGLDPDSAEFRTTLADWYQEDDPDRAMAEYQAAIASDPNFARAWHALGDLHMARKAFDLAISKYGKAIQLEPKGLSHYEARCAAYEAAGRYDQGIADASELIRRASFLPTEFQRRARLYYLMGDYDRAIADLTEAIRLLPKVHLFYEERGKVYQAMGEHAKAKEDHARSRR